MTDIRENANQGVAPSVRGIEIASRFFWEVGLPILEKKFPQHIDQLAAGLVAAGSDCSDNDDSVSRDFRWGPRFHVYLQQSDFDEIGSEMQATMDQLPSEFDGTVCYCSDAKSACRVYSIDEFFVEKVAFARVPESPVDWLAIEESHLFDITRGQVFYDPLGVLTERRKEFANYYPDEVWKNRLAANLYECGRQGQQVTRSMARGDYYTAQISWWSFVQSVMKVGFLLNRKYAPDQKWLYREFCKLPEPAVSVTNLLWEGQCDLSDRPRLVNSIAAIYDTKMLEMGLIRAELDDFSDSFARRAAEIAASIG